MIIKSKKKERKKQKKRVSGIAVPQASPKRQPDTCWSGSQRRSTKSMANNLPNESRSAPAKGGARGSVGGSRSSRPCKEDWANKKRKKERAQLQIELINRKLIGSHANASASSAPNYPNSNFHWVGARWWGRKFRFFSAVVKFRFVFISFNSIRVG